MKNAFYILIASVLIACLTRKKEYDLIISNISVIDPINKRIIPER